MSRIIFEEKRDPKRWLWLGVAAVLLVIAAFFLLNRNQTNYNYPEKGSNIISFGDSLVAGYGVEPGQDFSIILGKKIGKSIINAGRNGDTTEDALKRIDRDVLDQDPRVVIVLFGGNDFLQGYSKERTFKNLSLIIDRIQQKGAAVILVGVRGGILQDNFSKMFRQIAQQKHTFFVTDILKGLISNREYMHDSIHPNAKGHEIMAQRIEPQLRKALSGD